LVRPHVIEEIKNFECRIIPKVDLIRAAQATGSVGDFSSDFDELRDILSEFTALMPDDQIQATISDLTAWADSGFADDLRFDATRDSVPAPEDGQPAAFIGPVILPNGNSTGPFIEAFAVVRQDADCVGELQSSYPHPKAAFQSTKLLAASRGLRDGNCVVFFPENIPAAKPCPSQPFAWFFFNRHVRIYEHTLAITARLCGEGSPFAGEPELGSARVDQETVYQARCVWGYLHDYFHHTGPRPLDQHLALKTRWRTGLLEELKVDMKSAIACHDERVPYGDIIFEYIILERLFRYPAEPRPLRNFDAGTGFALGTWLAGHGLFSTDATGRRRLAPKAGIVESVRELVGLIEEIERVPEDDAYRGKAEDFLFDTLLLPPGDGNRYGGPRCAPSLWGAEVHV
jgi:Family of unknown function (DUF6421)